MENKNGFTLIELLGVIVILGIIMVIATSVVNKSIEESKEKARYIAAKEITEIAAAYIETETAADCVSVQDLINKDYLESDVTNPETGKNGGDFTNHQICKSNTPAQDGYSMTDNKYLFDGYTYDVSGSLVADYVLNEILIGGNADEADVTNDGKVDIEDYNHIMDELDKSLPGDVDLDKEITEADEELVREYINGTATLTDEQQELADINKDENVNEDDANSIQKLLESSEEYIVGDVNQDGKVTEEDANLVLKCAAGLCDPLTEEQQKLLDVNGDGKISAADSLAILKLINE